MGPEPGLARSVVLQRVCQSAGTLVKCTSGCFNHHLLKTFWPGWSDRQLCDGTVIWTDPEGNTYTTYPGSRLMFPELCAPTAEVTVTGSPPAKHTAGLTMPRRPITRAEARRQRIDEERARNQQMRENPENDCDDACFRSRPRHAEDDDPPPF
jgi:hypothetical protein